MRKSMSLVLCLLAGSSSVNAVQQPNPQLMQQMQAMQNCLKSVGPEKMQSLAVQGQQLHQEIKTLCAAGKRDDAMNRAMSYGKQLAADPAMQKLRDCSADMAKQFSTIPGMDHESSDSKGSSPKHICDFQQ